VSALELLACVALASVSAWLSASETALFSLSRFQLRSLKERFRSSHRKIKRLLADPTGLLITLLVVNEMVNIALSSIIAETLSEMIETIPPSHFIRSLPIPSWILTTVLSLLISTPLVLMLCEITPKMIGARANRLIAPLTASPLTVLYDSFRPARFVLSKLVVLVAKWTTPRGYAAATGSAPPPGPSEASPRDDADTNQNPAPSTSPDAHHSLETAVDSSSPRDGHPPERKLLRESDFLLMVEEGHREGAVQHAELELIKNVFELDDTTVAEVFTPLPQVQTLTERTTLRSALNMMRSQKYSRIPVTAGPGAPARRKVVGILYSKDLLKARLDPERMDMTVDALMRKPLFVSHTVKLNSLFRKFKQQRTHMAVVQATTGEALGIVTMSDVLETLFEDVLPDPDIHDEEDA
jgi:putative hemolysin